MSQRGPAPNVETSGGPLLVETMTSGSIALFGARQRHHQIQLRSGIDHPANAAKNSIHFSESTKPIDVNGCKTCGLRKQFLVCHVYFSPHWSQGQSGTTVGVPTLKFHFSANFRFRDASCSKLGTQKRNAEMRGIISEWQYE